MSNLGFVVVGINLQAETDLLQNGISLLLAGFTSLDCGFVLVLTVIHELAHGRLRVRGNLDQVEFGILSQTQSVLQRDNAYLLATGTDKTDLGNADTIVNAWFAND
ncbi:Uncharacterised protein [Mycobacterium tuberculosis]|nr:Uncharacterised protein [Mycobacterium tuberculosis]